MKIRLLAAVLATFTLSFAATARPVEGWNYEKMKNEADFIVIATPIASNDIDEKTSLPGIEEAGPDNKPHPVEAIGMETNFEIQTTLKGAVPLNRFILHHLRLANPPAQPSVNGPQLLSFSPDKKVRYLLFLKKEKDGSHFAAVTGQTDPAIAVFPLGAYP